LKKIKPETMKKIYFLIALTGLLFFNSCGSKKQVIDQEEAFKQTKQTDVQTIKYINKYSEVAKEEMRQYGIPASITMAQGILESAAGTSYLARTANNHFGIKCGEDWEGPRVFKDDDHKNECFRKYKNPEESFRDHSEFLAKRKRYAFLFRLPPSDYEAWAKGLKKAGYATDPSYPSKLIYLIEKYELDRLDDQVLNEMNVKVRKQEHTRSNDDTEKVIYEVKAGETLYTIAKKFGVPVSEIKELNNLVDYDIYEGQILVLKLPKNKVKPAPETKQKEEQAQTRTQTRERVQEQPVEAVEVDTPEPVREQQTVRQQTQAENYILHEVKPGETLYSLSKQYGVSMEEIKKANQLTDNVLSVGQVVKIPAASAETPSAPAETAEPSIPEYHVVQPGETLYRIHVKYGVPIEKLRELNNLPDNTIYPGQKIRLR